MEPSFASPPLPGADQSLSPLRHPQLLGIVEDAPTTIIARQESSP